MMGYTDRHFRMFVRSFSRQILLYTEMVTTQELLRGRHPEKTLTIYPEEHPLALQLGGSEPEEFARCAKMAADSGFDEINLNIGCPSPRVQKGRFGACLMKEPNRVADCVAAITQTTTIPVTVKTRIGVDECDHPDHLYQFIETVSRAGSNVFIIHARKAWLKGLSPKENRHIPPLNYPLVYQLKKDFPHLSIIINGGITTVESVQEHLHYVNGVMIGRAAYKQPLLLATLEKQYFNSAIDATPEKILLTYKTYATTQLQAGTKPSTLIRPLTGLFHNQPNAKKSRQSLQEIITSEIS